MRRFYLDSNVLIAHYSLDKPEEIKRKMVENAPHDAQAASR